MLRIMQHMPRRITKQTENLTRTFIREWREHRGLSQDRLVARVAERVDGFSKSSLSRIETAKQPYSQPILEALAWALSCEPADLIMRDPKSPIWSIMDALRDMTPDQQRQIAAVVEALKKAA